MKSRTCPGWVSGLAVCLLLLVPAPARPQGPAISSPAPDATIIEPEPLSPGPDAPATGTVVFFRGKQLLGAAVGFRIHEAGTDYGKLRYGTYFSVPLPAGRHDFQVNSWDYAYPLEVQAGQTHYMMGDVAGNHPALYESSAEAFEGMRATLKDIGAVPTAPPKVSTPPPVVAKSKVYGRLQIVSEDGRVYFPIPGSQRTSGSALTRRFEPNLSLLRLGSPMTADYTDLRATDDGWLVGSAAPGDYALVMQSVERDFKYRREPIALLRVAGTSPSTYTGDLTLTIGLDNTATFLEPQPYHLMRRSVEKVTESIQPPASVTAPNGASEPEISLWCFEVDLGTDLMMLKHGIAIATLSMGCQRPPGVE